MFILALERSETYRRAGTDINKGLFVIDSSRFDSQETVTFEAIETIDLARGPTQACRFRVSSSNGQGYTSWYYRGVQMRVDPGTGSVRNLNSASLNGVPL